MLTALTNDDRRHLGLSPLQQSWDEIVLGGTTLHLDGDLIRRRIRRADPVLLADYVEDEVEVALDPEHAHLLPTTGRGKPTRLTAATATSKIRTAGVMVRLGSTVEILNSRTGHAYPTADPDVIDAREIGAQRWLAAWKQASTDEDLADLAQFASDRHRRRLRYREGDVFAFRFTRREWGFGRVLMDRAARVAAGDLTQTGGGYLQYLGRVVLVQVFRTLAATPDADVDTLTTGPALPSHMVMDDSLTTGEWPVIGHAPVADHEIDHELLLGPALSFDDDRWFLQDGLRCHEIAQHTLFERLPDAVVQTLGHTSFAVTASGPSLRTEHLRACIEAESNDPHWQHARHDLRNPDLAELRWTLLAAFVE